MLEVDIRRDRGEPRGVVLENYILGNTNVENRTLNGIKTSDTTRASLGSKNAGKIAIIAKIYREILSNRSEAMQLSPWYLGDAIGDRGDGCGDCGGVVVWLWGVETSVTGVGGRVGGVDGWINHKIARTEATKNFQSELKAPATDRWGRIPCIGGAKRRLGRWWRQSRQRTLA